MRIFFILTTLLGGCLPELTVIEGERIRYEYVDSLSPCGGNVDYLDRVLVFLEHRTGVAAPAQLRFSWVLGQKDDIPEAFRPADASDWVVGGHAFSREPVHVHEMVHLVAPGTIPFFREGLAFAYGILAPNGLGPRWVDTSSLDPREIMTNLVLSNDEYLTAGLFVSFLLHRYGPNKFRELYSRLPNPPTLFAIRTAFRNVLGVELDDEVAAFRSKQAPCGADVFALQIDDCSAPLHAPQGKGWSFSGALDCSSPDVMGGLGPKFDFTSYRQFTLLIPTAGDYELFASGDEDISVRLGPCFGCVWDDPNLWLMPGERRTTRLQPGLYFLRISGESGEIPAYSITLQPRP